MAVAESVKGWGQPTSPADNQSEAGPPVWGWGMPDPGGPPDTGDGLQWIEPFAQNILLAAQAMTRLHTSLDGKFTK